MDAPDFSDTSRYPSQGKMIGPAWRAAWAYLEDGSWKTTKEISAVMTASGQTSEKTNQNLLGKAVKAKLLDRRYRMVGSRKVAQYRRDYSPAARRAVETRLARSRARSA